MLDKQILRKFTNAVSYAVHYLNIDDSPHNQGVLDGVGHVLILFGYYAGRTDNGFYIVSEDHSEVYEYEYTDDMMLNYKLVESRPSGKHIREAKAGVYEVGVSCTVRNKCLVEADSEEDAHTKVYDAMSDGSESFDLFLNSAEEWDDSTDYATVADRNLTSLYDSADKDDNGIAWEW